MSLPELVANVLLTDSEAPEEVPKYEETETETELEETEEMSGLVSDTPREPDVKIVAVPQHVLEKVKKEKAIAKRRSIIAKGPKLHRKIMRYHMDKLIKDLGDGRMEVEDCGNFVKIQDMADYLGFSYTKTYRIFRKDSALCKQIFITKIDPTKPPPVIPSDPVFSKKNGTVNLETTLLHPTQSEIDERVERELAKRRSLVESRMEETSEYSTDNIEDERDTLY